MNTITYIPHPTDIPFEYNQITDYIYLGSNQCCQLHFKKELLKKGIQADVSLEKERMDHPIGVKYFFWFPFKDKTAPTQDKLYLAASTLRLLVDKKIKTYVHCKRGHGRSPTVIAAYWILTGMTATEALKRIRKKRGIHPVQSQLKTLRSFEKRYRGK